MNTETYDFRLCIRHVTDEWTVEIHVEDELRAATHAPDLDTALRMAVPYLAAYCEGSDFDKLLGELRAAAGGE